MRRNSITILFWSGRNPKLSQIEIFTQLTVSDKKVNGLRVVIRAKFMANGKACAISTKEVILSADTMQPPQILELAGIDGQNLFESHGTPFRIDNPSGCKNFEGHLMFPIDFEVVDGGVALEALKNRKVLEQALADYAASHTGLLVGIFPSSALRSPPQIQSSKQTLSNTRFDALFSATRDQFPVLTMLKLPDSY